MAHLGIKPTTLELSAFHGKAVVPHSRNPSLCSHSHSQVPKTEPVPRLLEVANLLGCVSSSGNKGIAKNIRAESMEISAQLSPKLPELQSDISGFSLHESVRFSSSQDFGKGINTWESEEWGTKISPHAHTSDQTSTAPPKTCFSFLWGPWTVTAEKNPKLA